MALMSDQTAGPPATADPSITSITPQAAPADPTSLGERLISLDVIRGISVLGILLMNIMVMGLSFPAATNPGILGAEGSDFWAWLIPSVFFEGTFRTLFGMLFGAGVALFLARAEARVGAGAARSLHIRRSLWLIGFGLLDAYLLLWYGDILYLYGLMGLILWLFYRCQTRTLIIWTLAFAAISFLLSYGNAVSTEASMEDMAILESRMEAGETVSEEDQDRYAASQEQIAFMKPTGEALLDQAETIRGSYTGAARAFYPIALILQTLFVPVFGLWDSLITMLIGILLFRSGFLTGALPARPYWLALLLGYGIAVPLRLWHLGLFAQSGFDFVILNWNALWYDLERVSMAFGHLGLIMLMIKKGALPLQARLQAVGQMAFTNYLMHSLIGLILFIGLGYYLTLTRTELLIVIAAIWVLQLWYSPVWLRHYRFGPAEWLWRSLTYGKRQAMRRASRVAG